MSAEELDTEAIRALADESDRVGDVMEQQLRVDAKHERSVATTLRALLAENLRLRKVIEDAPHEERCYIRNWETNKFCDCWKAAAVGTNNEEGN